jgi:hypothetical protein
MYWLILRIFLYFESSADISLTWRWRIRRLARRAGFGCTDEHRFPWDPMEKLTRCWKVRGHGLEHIDNCNNGWSTIERDFACKHTR